MSNKSIEYQVVTMRIPKKLYADYKELLKAEGKVVTYEIREYMRKCVEKNKEK
ncbi:MAG: transcriptional regulator [Lactobacillus sp.]|nr:transcriptional regulator [Lactobacillus sp.]